MSSNNKLDSSEIYRLTITTDVLPKSLNKKLRMHFQKRHAETNSFKYLLASKIGPHKPSKPLEKAHIAITRHSYRMLDYDGLVGSMKPVVDALVKCGVLKDDSWFVTGAWEVDQVFRPKKQGDLLEISVTQCG